MVPISPISYPKEYKYIVVVIDDYLRAAMSYPVKNKSKAGKCIESFVKMSRNMLEKDEKVCYLRCDQAEEDIGGHTKDVLEKLGAELQLACPETPAHNGVAERYNQTLINKIRSYAYESKLPKNIWDLNVSFAYIKTQRKPGPKFQYVDIAVILIGYTRTGY